MLLARLNIKERTISQLNNINDAFHQDILYYIQSKINRESKANISYNWMRLENNFSMIDSKGNLTDSIIKLINNIYIRVNGDVELKNTFINNINSEQLYKIILYGTLGSKGTSLIKDACNYSLKHLRLLRRI